MMLTSVSVKMLQVNIVIIVNIDVYVFNVVLVGRLSRLETHSCQIQTIARTPHTHKHSYSTHKIAHQQKFGSLIFLDVVYGRYCKLTGFA